MDVDRFLHDPRSRRSLFVTAGGGFAGGAAVLLAACGGGDDDGRTATAVTQEAGSGDVEILNGAIDLENTAIAAYSAGAALLRGATLRAARTILEQETEHAQALAQAVTQLGGTPNRPKPTAEYQRMFPRLRRPVDVLRFAHDLENRAIAAYIDAIPRLSDGKLRQTAAAITTNEAEHVTFLRQGLGQEPGVPDAFVTGKR